MAFDESLDQFELAKTKFKLNYIDFSKFKIIEKLVDSINLYCGYNQNSEKIINICKVKFDVLETDCEGS